MLYVKMQQYRKASAGPYCLWLTQFTVSSPESEGGRSQCSDKVLSIAEMIIGDYMGLTLEDSLNWDRQLCSSAIREGWEATHPLLLRAAYLCGEGDQRPEASSGQDQRMHTRYLSCSGLSHTSPEGAGTQCRGVPGSILVIIGSALITRSAYFLL